MDPDIEKLLRELSRKYKTDFFDPVSYILATNKLLPLKKDAALTTIEEFVRVHPSPGSMAWMLLLRVLFNVPKDPGYMPPMKVGIFDPPNLPDQRVPRFPIILYKDIPLLNCNDLRMYDARQPVSEHIDYYRKRCTLRDAPLKPPRGARSLLPEIKSSPQWVAPGAEDFVTAQLQRVQKYFG
jgi:hypothetical protein